MVIGARPRAWGWKGFLAALSCLLVCGIGAAAADGFYDDRYHSAVLFKWDRTELDVLVLPYVGPFALERDRAIQESLDAWRQGITDLASPELAEAIDIRVHYAADDALPADGRIEVAVVSAEPGVLGVGVPSRYICDYSDYESRGLAQWHEETETETMGWVVETAAEAARAADQTADDVQGWARDERASLQAWSDEASAALQATVEGATGLPDPTSILIDLAETLPSLASHLKADTGAEDPLGLQHQHPGSAWAVASMACDVDHDVCLVLNTNWRLTNNGMFDLNTHELGHCLGLGHVGNADDFSATTVPPHDIMGYDDQPLRVSCVSTLNIVGLQAAFGEAAGLPVPATDSVAWDYREYVALHPNQYRQSSCHASVSATDAMGRALTDGGRACVEEGDGCDVHLLPPPTP